MSETMERSTVQQIAEDLVAMCRRGEYDASGEKYWADDVVSIEAMPGDMARIQGIGAVRAKGEWWAANHEVHGAEVEGPFVNGDQFLVRFRMDLTPRDGARRTMDELGLYTIRNGKIAEERFFYAT